jgi:tripartite-type tricarboxylate transporter receptor subunit TctC
MIRRTLIFGIICIFLGFAVSPLLGADFPSRTITYCVPWPPGGQSDVEARRQQPMLEKILGVKVIIKLKPGGGGSLGWSELIKKKPDGYFICGINVPHIVLQPLARGNAGYKTEQLWPIALFQATPIGLAVMKESGLKTLKDFIQYAKKNPGTITCGGSGTWSGHHIAHLEFGKLTGTKMTYIPHKGAPPSVARFLGGHIMALWANSNDLVMHKDKIRVLAIGSAKRFSHFPDTPTFKELGIDLSASIDRGVATPPGTPAEQIQVLEAAFLKIARDPRVQKEMLEEGFIPVQMGSKESKIYIAEKVKTYKPIVKEFKK